ncbi:unnamed protein product [Ectocarpus fasciculatus]
MQKIILVTGANKGIGKAICQRIVAEHTDTFVLLGSRDAGRGAAAVDSIVQAVGESARSRISVLPLDVSDDSSVQAAAVAVAERFASTSPAPLYAIVNNAGIFTGKDLDSGIQTNIFGPYRVCNAFIPLLSKDNGRIVNVASAAGPMFVDQLPEADKAFFLGGSTVWSHIDEKVQFARTAPDSWSSHNPEWFPYGFAKACLNVYTMQLARAHPSLTVSSCTPGLIATDLALGAGLNASKSPEEGAVSPLFGLFGEGVVSGAYYGSDAVRSPLDKYRGPGDPPYEP